MGEEMVVKQDDVMTHVLQYHHYAVYNILQLFGPLGSEGGVHL